MVKNTIGGKKGKMLANKRSGSGSGDKKLRLSMNIDEIYLCVSKVFGYGMFEVIDNNGKEYKAHLRGKMKGPNKRHNFVSLFSFLLVGLRSDLSDSTNCDILFVYDDHDVLSLSLLPNLNLANLISFHHNHSFNQKNSNDLFGVIQNESVIMDNNVHDSLDIDITDSDFIDFNDI